MNVVATQVMNIDFHKKNFFLLLIPAPSPTLSQRTLQSPQTTDRSLIILGTLPTRIQIEFSQPCAGGASNNSNLANFTRGQVLNSLDRVGCVRSVSISSLYPVAHWIMCSKVIRRTRFSVSSKKIDLIHFSLHPGRIRNLLFTPDRRRRRRPNERRLNEIEKLLQSASAAGDNPLFFPLFFSKTRHILKVAVCVCLQFPRLLLFFFVWFAFFFFFEVLRHPDVVCFRSRGDPTSQDVITGQGESSHQTRVWTAWCIGWEIR